MIFRYLRADEVEARISIVKDNGLSLLLYKDARCDMNILDETVGLERWQRLHELIDGQLFCNVGIWFDRRNDGYGEWVWKQDVGTESFAEKEKGRASDSFKRACFNWGIGRELYTAPFIWISADKCKLVPRGQGFTCYDRFKVTSMAVENGKITELTIYNESTKNVCFTYGDVDQNEKVIKETNALKIDSKKWNALMAVAQRKGVDYKAILAWYGLKQGGDMTIAQWKEAFSRVEKMEDKVNE